MRKQSFFNWIVTNTPDNNSRRREMIYLLSNPIVNDNPVVPGRFLIPSTSRLLSYKWISPEKETLKWVQKR